MSMYLEKFHDPILDLYYYRISRGQTMYRGDTEQYHAVLSKKISEDSYIFRSLEYFTPELTELYGLTLTFTAVDDLYLLAMDESITVNFLLSHADEDLKKKITTAFNTSSRGRSQVLRNSIANIDREIATFICSISELLISEGFPYEINGYATDKMATNEGDDEFHAEIMLCNPGDKVEFRELVPYPEDKIKQKYDQHIDRKHKPNEKKKVKSLSESSIGTLPRRLFDD